MAARKLIGSMIFSEKPVVSGYSNLIIFKRLPEKTWRELKMK